MLGIIPFREEHLEDGARLVRDRYQRLREQVPDLPQRYSDVSSLAPLLQDILKPGVPGVAAVQGNRLVGFLTAWLMPDFRGKRSIYVPEWANAAVLDDSARIYEAMYSCISGDWLAKGYSAHYLSILPNDIQALCQWHWLGFGMFAVDALRALDPIPVGETGVHIRRAGLQDIEQVMALQDELWEYIKSSPIFILSKRYDRKYYEEWLQNPDKVIWLACSQDEPLAFMRMGPAAEDVCTIIIDEKTTSIYAAFTRAPARREGIATALLAHALEFARAGGYQRCAVPFEPMNPLGSRFWLRYFQPVCYSFLRNIDEQLTQG
jgi:GNAT superfamily N-acetyltransferase